MNFATLAFLLLSPAAIALLFEVARMMDERRERLQTEMKRNRREGK